MAAESSFFQYLFSNETLFSLPGEMAQVAQSNVHSSDEQENQAGAAGASAAPSVFRSLKSRVLILVNTYGKGIQPNEMAFLTKVLAAVKYSPETVDLLELDKIGTSDASEVLEHRLADYILLFGVKPETVSLPVKLDLFEPRIENGVWMLMSNSLLRIEMEESRRRDLWNALKKVFLR